MHPQRATAQLAEIHRHLHGIAVCRGFRAGPTAGTVVLAGLGATVQAVLAPQSGPQFVLLWLAVATVGATVCALDLWWTARTCHVPLFGQRTGQVLRQFAGPFALGATVAVALADSAPGLLPGLWSALFGTALLASVPFMPRHVAKVGIFYVGAGALLLLTMSPFAIPGAAVMGLTFGLGQTLAACVLFQARIETEGPARPSTSEFEA